MTPEILSRIDRLTLLTYNRVSKEIDATLDKCSQIVTGARKEIAFDPLVGSTGKGISKEFDNLYSRLQLLIENSIKQSWEYGNLNYDEITKRYLTGKQVKESLRNIYFDHNSKALQAFIERDMNGLKLSDRVWNIANLSQTELGLLVEDGMAVGKSAAELSRDVRYILKEPEKRFRRVRNDAGDLVPSKAMKQFHPGQGVYRSSYKNALRLTGSEINMSYCTAEHTRQQQLDFVTGQEVKLSGNHPAIDICDSLKGKYPKDFLFRKWHPKCRCYDIPILMDSDSFDEYLSSGDMPNVPKVEDIPQSAKDYLNDKPFEGWKNKPYFVQDNAKYLNENGSVQKDVKNYPNPLFKDSTVRMNNSKIYRGDIRDKGDLFTDGNDSKDYLVDGEHKNKAGFHWFTESKEFATDYATKQMSELRGEIKTPILTTVETKNINVLNFEHMSLKDQVNFTKSIHEYGIKQTMANQSKLVEFSGEITEKNINKILGYNTNGHILNTGQRYSDGETGVLFKKWLKDNGFDGYMFRLFKDNEIGLISSNSFNLIKRTKL